MGYNKKSRHSTMECRLNLSPLRSGCASALQSSPNREARNHGYLFWMYSSMALAAALPAPMALMTVAAPVTASPPA